jgi:hypothetical protein
VCKGKRSTEVRGKIVVAIKEKEGEGEGHFLIKFEGKGGVCFDRKEKPAIGRGRTKCHWELFGRGSRDFR